MALVVLCGNAALAATAPDPKTVRTWKTKPDWQKSNSDEKMRQAILNGVKKEGTEGMDGYKDVLSPEQVDALIAYVRSLAKG